MASSRRRSARISNRSSPQRSTKSVKADPSSLLGALIERDETPETFAPPSIDKVLSSPVPNVSVQSRFARLSNVKTPTSEPKPTREQMHPQTAHQTTTKAPDSGLRLGFGDLPAPGSCKSIAALQNTPSKSQEYPSDIQSSRGSTYEFKFRTDSHLSNEAQRLMDNLRDEAAWIKEQMRAEKATQDGRDAPGEGRFEGFGAVGRKIAKPTSKTGRFSDVHMAAFKKMDSIANHASAFRTNNAPGFAQATVQSLKRSPSKAGLDEPVRPQTAGKGTPGRKQPASHASNQRTTNPSSFKSLPSLPKEVSSSSPVKRQRQSEFGDVSTGRAKQEHEEKQRPNTLPRPTTNSSLPSNLLSPTKASLARSNSVKSLAASEKPSMLPRSQSSKAFLAVSPSKVSPAKSVLTHGETQVKCSTNKFPTSAISKIPRSESSIINRPLPPLPTEQKPAVKVEQSSQPRDASTRLSAKSTKDHLTGSRLPTLAALKSILRPSRPQGLQQETIQPKTGTPKRPNTASYADSAKKVDFTPSVKSRYAVKLAAESPSPAKIHQDTPLPPNVQFDPSAYAMSDDNVDEEEWEDADEEGFDHQEATDVIAYPSLPPTSPVQKKSPSVQTVQAFLQKAKGVNRRESLDFKSIVANGIQTSSENPFSMTAFNTAVNKTLPIAQTNLVVKSPNSTSKVSSSTIRQVRSSDAADTTKFLSHGLSAKKRSRQSERYGSFDEYKENQSESSAAKIPGGWEDSILDEDEGEKRGGKRLRVDEGEVFFESPQKKANPSREAAAKAAKDRKKKGILSMSRLNMLARPKGQ